MNVGITWRLRFAVVLGALVLVTGGSCARTRWKKGDSYLECCHDAESCTALLQEVEGPDPGAEREVPSDAQGCAIYRTSDLGPSVIPHLIPLLEHGDSRVRNGAASALGRRGVINNQQPRALSAVPALITLAEREPRGSALRALVSIDDARALPVLRKHLAEVPASRFAVVGPNVAGMMLELLEDPAASQKELRHIRDAVKLGDPSSNLGHRFGLDKAVRVPRLRALLKRELDAPVLLRPPDAVCPAAPAASCTPIFDGCAPRAAYVVSVIEGLVRYPEEEAWEELRQAFQRGDPRLTPVALDALVRFRSPDVVKPLVQELAHRDCQLHALQGLRVLGPVARPEAMSPLRALLDSPEEGWVRALAAEALLFLSEESDIDLLRRTLEADHTEVQAVAVGETRVEDYRKHGAALLPLLEKLADQSPSPNVRWWALMHMAEVQVGEREARDALDAMTKKLRELILARKEGGSSPGIWQCPRFEEREGGHAVKDGDGMVLLREFPERSRPLEARGACSGVPDLEDADIIEPLGEGCLVGQSNGEFGGSLSFYAGGERAVLAWMNAERMVKMHGTVVVLSRLMHLNVAQGELARVEQTASGEWRAVPWVKLPGPFSSYGHDREGNLVLSTMLPYSMGYFGGWEAADCAFDVVRITPDGQLSSVR